MTRHAHRRGTLALIAGVVLFVALGAAIVGWLSMGQTASLEGTSAAEQHAPADENQKRPTASIDWDYWKKVNPAIVAWITIPGTPVNYPVVAPPADDPDFYLTHDVFGNFNWFGCIYRDPDCAASGSRNVVLYGHNMGGGDRRMFGSLAAYMDPAFARAHRRVIIQTPHRTRTYRICAAEVVNGWQARKHIRFTGADDFTAWWNKTYRVASMRLHAKTPRATHLLTLCTCSYHRWDNERTLIYAVPANNP